MALSPELDEPIGLKPGMTIDTPAGTWRKFNSGFLDLKTTTIFDANKHFGSKNTYPKVTDINAFTSNILEEEMGRREAVQQPTVRRPLSVRKLTTALGNVLLG